MDDLPVLLGHRVLADEERLAGEHADAPVEFGRHEALREQEVGLLEELRDGRLQLVHGLGLAHAAAERAVGNLHHHREAERVGGALDVGRVLDDDRLRHRQPGMRQPLPEIDLVGAADHRDRIVDDRHALHHGAAGEAVGVVADRGRLADEQRVELGQPGEILARDRLDLDAERGGELRPVHQRRRACSAAAAPSGRRARRSSGAAPSAAWAPAICGRYRL